MDIIETWNSYISSHFKQAASPLECGARLVPVLLESHWYLLELDWIDSDLRIQDPPVIATRGQWHHGFVNTTFHLLMDGKVHRST